MTTILNRILNHEFYKTNKENIFVPWIEYSNIPVPSIISGSTGKFLISDKLHPGDIVKSGTFSYPNEDIDDFLNPMISKIIELSKREKWNNTFSGKNAATKAFEYLKNIHGHGHPHICLVPESWDGADREKALGKAKIENNKYDKYCRILSASIDNIVFCVSPNKIGIYTQLMNNTHSILVHGMETGMSFVI